MPINKVFLKKLLSIVLLLVCIFQFFPKSKSLGEKQKSWFDSYDINDTHKMWEMLMKPITILDVPEKTKIYLLDAPDGKRLKDDKLGGYINGGQAGVKVIGQDENGYTLIEGYDDYDRLLRGYVKTSLLKTVSPRNDMGLIIDKLTQKIHIFKDGKYLSNLNISTGLANDEQPYNESSTGEYLITSWVGDFKSGNMLCRKAIRYNGGDLLHMVPCKVLADGTYDYSAFESKLGSRASHGCIRIQQKKNDDGINMDWLWDNLKKNTKVIVWDDDGRQRPYPDDYKKVYYNKNGGKYYHATAMCHGVKNRYLPLTQIYYGQLRDDEFSKLTPCPICQPPIREEKINEMNKSALSDEDYNKLMESRNILHSHFNSKSAPAQIVQGNIELEEPTENISKNNQHSDSNTKPVQYSDPHIDESEVVLGIGN